MKVIALLGLLALAACARQAPEIAAPKVSAQVATNDIFNDTSAARESKILAAASALLVQGSNYPTKKQIKLCLVEETKRPKVRNVCLLLAAKAELSDEYIDEAIQQESERSAEGAIAIAWRPELINNYSVERLKNVMKLLEPYPDGLRTRLASHWSDWAERQSQQNYFRQTLGKGTSFTEFTDYFNFFVENDPEFAQQQANGYCNKLALGFGSWGCLRLKAAVVLAKGSRALCDSLLPGGDLGSNNPKESLGVTKRFAALYPTISAKVDEREKP